jgi:hypothetical protein
MTFNYEGINALADKLGRPVQTLIALAAANDPFYIAPYRQVRAEWFAELWERLGVGAGWHLRRFHYRIISQTAPVTTFDGAAYENTVECWSMLGMASRDARFLKLVPAEHFVDRRNDVPIIHLPESADSDAKIIEAREEPDPEEDAMPSVSFNETEMPTLPYLCLQRPNISQRFHVELWCEKTTVNDVLEPLAQLYGCNLITGSGQLSAIACDGLIERAKANGRRPVRILYLSDFDPAGASMPVAVARKIEFAIRTDGLDLDIQVRPIVLTHEQCRKYRLPRTPIKETDLHAAPFEERFGQGATELDAPETVRPGELRKIVKLEIERYYDPDLADSIEETAREVNSDIIDLENKVEEEHREQIEELESEWTEIMEEAATLQEEMQPRCDDLRAKIDAWKEQATSTYQAMCTSLNERAPDVDSYDWPEPDEGNEDEDPLFDSTRDYVEQMDRYKEHQGQPTERVGYGARPERQKEAKRASKARREARKKARR